jgi:HAD superfamily hydrolase (TIGR01509 family)
MIKALIFDFDGLIVDTEGPDYQAWQETYESFGCRLPLAEWAAEIGTYGVFDPYDYLARQLGRPIDRAAVRAQRHTRFAELIEQQTVLPGVERYIRDARERGLRVGIASSSSRTWVVGHLVRFGLDDSFDCIKTADDVERVKPDPALYRAALDALDVQAHEALAFEDSPNGALAATRAGIYCVAVPNLLTQQLALEVADLRLASLAELPLDELLARVEAIRGARTAA